MVVTRDLFAADVLTEAALRRGGVGPEWQAVLDTFWETPGAQGLLARLRDRMTQGARLYPPQPWRALALTPLSKVRVVILGQDPYHGPGQAEGLAFSVPQGVRVPPSLRNIHKELVRDLGMPVPAHGSLTAWAQHGVLLLNTVLTVEDGQPAAHARWGWEDLTDRLLQAVCKRPQPCAYLLWGAHAQSKRALIEANARGPCLVLSANHPSPLSALRPPQPFIGCSHFSLTSQWLAQHGLECEWLL